MKLEERCLVPLAAATLLIVIALQSVTVSMATAVPPGSLAAKPVPGFRVVGSAPDGLPVTVSLAIPLRNVGLLSSLVKQVSDPTSPMFRHYLSQQQLASDFYPTSAFDQLMQYLSTTGLQVQSTALDSAVVVRGSAAQVEQAFGTGVDIYSNGTASYYMSTSQSFMGAYLFASNATALELKPELAASGAGGANVTFTEGSVSPKLLQRVYNATSLYSQGFTGAGKTIGLLDFYGSPTITSDLATFDHRFGFPNATFNIIPIGPYDPNLGVFASWSTEVSIDVEMSHAMAPGATIDLYVASGASTLSDAISKIVKDDKVNTLSQSFSEPDWAFNYLGPGYFDLNALMPDQYYMLGALKGITFTAATGDTGGSGDTSGIEGQLGYPADSPFVTAVGGTQTYFAGSSVVQTAWSNLGFVPNGVNYGGSSGGVSILEPKPWYQASQGTPATLPAGRMSPDLSVQAGVDPATDIVDAGLVIGEGGTSESSPIFAGLVTLLDSSVNASVGLVNPFLYSVGNNRTAYAEGFTPITFGYNIPWVASSGYNLVTGWGSPNIGGIRDLYVKERAQPALNVTVEVHRGSHSSGLEYLSGELLRFNATIEDGRVPVTSGSFTAALVTLTGSTAIPLQYNATARLWTGSMTMADQSGIAYVEVQGSSAGLSGSGFAPIFAGYFGLFLSPLPTDPWSTIGGLRIDIHSITLDGNVTGSATLKVDVETYSITSNSYTRAAAVSLPLTNGTLYGTVNEGDLNQTIPSGPSVMVIEGGTYGYLPFVSGIYLQTSFVYPPVVAEPGAAAPGQELTIVAAPVAPFNLYFTYSQETGNDVGADVAVGSNVTARLLSPSGTVVSRASLAYQPCVEALKICAGGTPSLNGYLGIPLDSPPGLYTVLLDANYSSDTVGKTLNGSFFSQVWVSGGPAQPVISIEPGSILASAATDTGTAPSHAPQALYEGEQAHVIARISYPNGTSARYGVYTAIVYPQSLEKEYTTLMHTEYANSELVQLTYDPALEAWLGNVTLPGPANRGTVGPLGLTSFFYSGPYEVYVTGISNDGLLTTTARAAQQQFFIQPYVFVDGGDVTSLTQNSGFAFSSATIRASGSLDGDVFLGTNVVQGGTLSITDSLIQGSLEVHGANVTLVGDSGGDVSATNSTLSLRDSSVGSLSLDGSRVNLTDSSYQSVHPVLPRLAVGGLSKPLSGAAPFNITMTGSGVAPGSLTALLDGNSVALNTTATASGLSAEGTINATALGDGVHTLVLTVVQPDGLSSTLTVPVTTDSEAARLSSQLAQANTSIGSLQGRLSQSEGSVNVLYLLSVSALVVAALAIVLLVFVARRRTAAN